MIVDQFGDVFVADTDHQRVLYFDTISNKSHRVAGTGVFGSWTNLFKQPVAIAGENFSIHQRND
jgi:hypothetical protein